MRLIVLVCAAAASSAALAQGGERMYTRADTISCNPQFERVKEVVLRAHPVFIEKMRSQPKPRPSTQFSINLAERKLAEAKSKSALDYWWGDVDSKPLLDSVTTNKDLRETRERLAVLKSGDESKINQVYGVVYRGLDLEYRIIHTEADICVLEVRQAILRTGKPPVAR